MISEICGVIAAFAFVALIYGALWKRYYHPYMKIWELLSWPKGVREKDED